MCVLTKEMADKQKKSHVINLRLESERNVFTVCLVCVEVFFLFEKNLFV